MKKHENKSSVILSVFDHPRMRKVQAEKIGPAMKSTLSITFELHHEWHKPHFPFDEIPEQWREVLM